MPESFHRLPPRHARPVTKSVKFDDRLHRLLRSFYCFRLDYNTPEYCQHIATITCSDALLACRISDFDFDEHSAHRERWRNSLMTNVY
jgi:hypothetical protein